jgi:haloalkane dehalogenase
MDALRTPDEAFANLPGYTFKPHYTEVDDLDGGTLRIHHIDEGPADDAETVLLMHGEPSWSYLYRHMIPVLNEAGLRTVAPDLVGFGRSDKPARAADHTYERHVAWMSSWLVANDLRGLTLVCQDWGGLIGLRLLAAHPDRFRRLVVANTGLPTGDRPPAEAFLKWQKFSQTTPDFDCGVIVAMSVTTQLSPEEIAAYNAPFPDDSYKAAPRTMPTLVPTSPDDPSAQPNRDAWKVLEAWDGPTVIAFSDSDPVTKGGDGIFNKIAGSVGQPHTTIVGGGHFLQEDQGPQLAQVVTDLVERTPGA